MYLNVVANNKRFAAILFKYENKKIWVIQYFKSWLQGRKVGVEWQKQPPVGAKH